MNYSIYPVTIIIFLLLDAIYMKGIAYSIFAPMIERIQKSPMVVNQYGGLIVYILMTILHVHFVPNNVLQSFIIGVCVYGIYDFTNYALFKDYTLTASLVDTLWGGILFALTTFIVKKIYAL